MSNFNMPYQKEKEASDNKKSAPLKQLWKALPLKAGSSHSNDVIIPLCSPNTWQLFNPTPEQVRKYGMCTPGVDGLVALNAANPMYTFYFKLPVHDIPAFNRPDGTQGWAQVLCPVQLNQYLVLLGQQPLFENPRCAHCEEEARLWEVTNQRWDTCGTDKGSLSTEGYFDFIEKDPILGPARKAIASCKVREKYFIPIFDHAKFRKDRPLDEGEAGVEHQAWLASVGIFEKLVMLFEAGLRFFENSSAGFPVLSIVRDNTNCVGASLMKTKYDVITVNRFHAYEADWVAYLTNYAAMVDPSKLVHLISYEEGRFYVEQMKSAGNDYQVPATAPPIGVPPVAGAAPLGTMAPSVAASPLGAPPTSAPPTGVPPVAGAAPLGTMAPSVVASPMGAPPTSAPPTGVPPVAGVAPVAVSPVPTQPPAPAPPVAVSPVATVPAVAGTAPPERAATPPAGDAPPRRQW